MSDESPNKSLSHLDDSGRARMVDVGAKAVTSRRAVAEARVKISRELQEAITKNAVKKGNLLDVARLAGIGAAKRTDELIPLCHSLPLDAVHVDTCVAGDHVYIRAESKTTGKTGVEMEAYTAAAVAALTVIDMGKSIDPGMVIESIRLVEKEGGKRGHLTPHPSEYPGVASTNGGQA
ncbi:MAG: cyclic pyranopterin monophosphate synthase MoaC [Planctomycetota bacterium]|jgi:cyclic pyranopterin phosphate synthase